MRVSQVGNLECALGRSLRYVIVVVQKQDVEAVSRFRRIEAPFDVHPTRQRCCPSFRDDYTLGGGSTSAAIHPSHHSQFVFLPLVQETCFRLSLTPVPCNLELKRVGSTCIVQGVSTVMLLDESLW